MRFSFIRLNLLLMVFSTLEWRRPTGSACCLAVTRGQHIGTGLVSPVGFRRSSSDCSWVCCFACCCISSAICRHALLDLLEQHRSQLLLSVHAAHEASCACHMVFQVNVSSPRCTVILRYKLQRPHGMVFQAPSSALQLLHGF